MFEIFGRSFFQALKDGAEEKLGPDHPCTHAVARVVETGAQSDIENAQLHLAELNDDVAANLMEAAHKTMREDPDALLKMWGGEAGPGRVN